MLIEYSRCRDFIILSGLCLLGCLMLAAIEISHGTISGLCTVCISSISMLFFAGMSFLLACSSLIQIRRIRRLTGSINWNKLKFHDDIEPEGQIIGSLIVLFMVSSAVFVGTLKLIIFVELV